MSKIIPLRREIKGTRESNCGLEVVCPIRMILDKHPGLQLSSTYFAGSSTDGKGVEAHSEIPIEDINILMRLLDRMQLKLNDMYQDSIGKRQ